MNARAALAALLALSSWSPSAYAALAFPDLGAARRPLSPEAAPERPPEQPNPRQRLLDDLGELQHDPRVARFLQDHPDAVLSLSQENGREAIEARYPPPDRSRHIFVLPSPERPDLEHNYLHYSPEGYVIGQGNYAVGPDGGIQFKEEKVLLDGHDVHGTTPDAPVPGGEQAVSLVSHQDEEETQESATPRLLHPGFVPPERLNLCAEGGTRCYVFGSGTRANVLYYVGADGERVPVGALRTFNVQNAPGESLEFLTVLGQGGAQAYARNGTWLGAWSELEQQALSINRREAAGSERPMLPVQFHGGYVTQAVDADGVLYQVASWRDDGAGRQVPVYRRHALFSARPHPPAGTFDYAHFGRNEEEARRLGLPGYWGSGGASELSRLYWFDAQGVGRHIGSQWNNQEDGRGVNLINIAPPDSQTGVEVFGRIFIANADFYQRRAGTLAVAGDGGQHWGVRRGLTTTDPAGAQRRVYQWAHFVPAGHAPDGRRLYRAHGADALEELRFVEGSSSGGNRYFDVYTPPAAPAAAPAPAAALTPGSLTLGSGPGAVTVSIVSHEGRLYVATADGRLRYPIAAGAAFARETVYDRILAPERNVHAIALDIEDGQADGDQAPGAYYRHFLVVTRGADGRPALRFANTVYDWRTSREDGNVTSHLRFDAFPAGGSGSGPYVDGTAPGGAGGASVDLSGAWGSLRGLATGTFDRLRGGLSNAGGAALERARSLGGAILPLAGQAADRIASMMPSAPPSASAVPPSTPPGPPPITLEDLRGIRGLARDAAGQAAANLQRRTEDLTRRARAAGGGLLPLAEQAVERLAGMIPPPPPPSASATPPPPPAGPPPVTLEQLRGVWNAARAAGGGALDRARDLTRSALRQARALAGRVPPLVDRAATQIANLLPALPGPNPGRSGPPGGMGAPPPPGTPAVEPDGTIRPIAVDQPGSPRGVPPPVRRAPIVRLPFPSNFISPGTDTGPMQANLMHDWDLARQPDGSYRPRVAGPMTEARRQVAQLLQLSDQYQAAGIQHENLRLAALQLAGAVHVPASQAPSPMAPAGMRWSPNFPRGMASPDWLPLANGGTIAPAAGGFIETPGARLMPVEVQPGQGLPPPQEIAPGDIPDQLEVPGNGGILPVIRLPHPTRSTHS